jgi:hypothetical protein
MHIHWTWPAALVAAAALTFVAGVSHAGMFTETSDAGDTLATADATGSMGTQLTTIFGSLQSTGTDADLYVIDITSPATFSASTNNTMTNTGFTYGSNNLVLDTSLFLFDASGNAVAANDDTSGSILTSTISGAQLNLTAGIYYLGISITGNEPVNSANQLLFATNDDATAVRGPETFNNLNPTTLSTFNSNNYDDENGNYQIDLTGVDAAPEPSSWAAAALGASLVAYLSLRRGRRRETAGL